MMSVQLSYKIRIASFVCTMMVVYRHSLNYLAFFDSWVGTGLSGWFEDGMSLFTEIAIPYFFIVSGYFFFRGDFTDAGNYKKMIIKKYRTLLIPFLIWNVVGMFALWYTNRDSIGDSFETCAQNLAQSKWYGPLWYVRDLMVLMALAPLYSWVFKLDNKIVYLALLTFCIYYWYPVDISFLSSEGILFFLLGGCLQKNQSLVAKEMRPTFSASLLLIWLFLCFSKLASTNLAIHKLNTVLGIVVFWQLLNILIRKMRGRKLIVVEFSFLIYVLHFNIQKAMKSVLGYYFHGNDIAALLSYILLPITVAAIIVGIGTFMKKYCPRFLSFVTGGR